MVPGVTWLLRQVGALRQFNRFAWKCRTACNAEELAPGGEIEKAFIFARPLLVTIHCFWEKTVFSWFGWWTVSTALNLANTVKHVLVTVKGVSFPYQVFLILVQEERWSVFLRGRNRAPQVLTSVEFFRVCMVPQGKLIGGLPNPLVLSGQCTVHICRPVWYWSKLWWILSWHQRYGTGGRPAQLYCF